jgi:hypothetical protein
LRQHCHHQTSLVNWLMFFSFFFLSPLVRLPRPTATPRTAMARSTAAGSRDQATSRLCCACPHHQWAQSSRSSSRYCSRHLTSLGDIPVAVILAAALQCWNLLLTTGQWRHATWDSLAIPSTLWVLVSTFRRPAICRSFGCCSLLLENHLRK